MSKNEPPETGNRSGGGIVFGGGSRGSKGTTDSAVEIAAGLRRRWPSGVAVVTATDPDGGFRGITLTSLMAVSQEPPLLAIALTASTSFQELAVIGATLGVSLLDSIHQFPAERFAGRAPIPDARFSGVAHMVIDGVPILADAPGWCIGTVRRRDDAGDHILVLIEIESGGIGPDTDDPLLSYESRYRRLEAS